LDTRAMKEGPEYYLTKVIEIVNKIRSLGDTIEYKKVVSKVIRSIINNMIML